MEPVAFVPPELQLTDSPTIVEPTSYVQEVVVRWGIVLETMESQVVPPAQPGTPLQQVLDAPPQETEGTGGDPQEGPEEQEPDPQYELAPEPELAGDNSENPPQAQATASTQNSQAAQDVRDWIRRSYGPLARGGIRTGLQPLIDLLNNLPDWIQATTATQNGELAITFTVTIVGVTIPVGQITLVKSGRFEVEVHMGPVTITGGIGGTTISLTLSDGTEIVLYPRPN